MFKDIQQKTPKKKEEPLKLVRPLKWYKPSLEVSRGIKIGIAGKWKTGKSILSVLFAYFNSKYKKDIKEAGYDKVIEVMNAGLLSEIERVIIIEPENKFLTNLTRGDEKKLLRPFVEEGIMDIIPLSIPRKEARLTKKGFEISQQKELFQQQKEQFVDTVEAIVNDFGEDTLLIIDTMTAFKKLLDDKFGLLEDIVLKKEEPSLEGINTFQWSHFASRNTSWHNIMQTKQGFKGWNVDVYKSKPKKRYDAASKKWVDSEFEYTVEWVGGTMHYLDMGFRLVKKADKVVDVEIIDGEYTPKNPKEWVFRYPFDTKMGAMPLISSMCEKLLAGEEEE